MDGLIRGGCCGGDRKIPGLLKFLSTRGLLRPSVRFLCCSPCLLLWAQGAVALTSPSWGTKHQAPPEHLVLGPAKQVPTEPLWVSSRLGEAEAGLWSERSDRARPDSLSRRQAGLGRRACTAASGALVARVPPRGSSVLVGCGVLPLQSEACSER